MLIIILAIGIFFRLYKLNNFFYYGHEQDLQTFIIKDILVNLHPRLIGQETSIRGIFIGPLYYYTEALSVYLTNMDPRGLLMPITLVSVATMFSVYWVVKKLFNKNTGLIAAYLYAISINIVFLDRWAVPTQTTFLWTIWFLYVVVSLTKSSLSGLPILIILIALIWHIHVAFVPLLVLLPIAWVIAKKTPKELLREVKKQRKNIIYSLVIAGLLLVPLVAFELRHNFSQTRSLLGLFSEDRDILILTGIYKIQIISENTGRVLMQGLLNLLPLRNTLFFRLQWGNYVFLALVAFLYYKKALPKKVTIIIVSWIGVVAASLFIIQKALSEYYFNNLFIVSIVVFAILFNYLLKYQKYLTYLVLVGLLALNSYYLVTKPEPKTEFLQKRGAVEFIGQDVKNNKYPCVAINYIGNLGVEYGYRYLFWKNNVNLVSGGNDIPVYSLVIPYTISESEIAYRYDDIGVILPQDKPNYNFEVCTKPERQLLPLNGFVN